MNIKMNKITAFIFLILAPFRLFCGEGDSIKPSKIQLGILYSPEYAYRTLQATPSDAEIKSVRNFNELPKLGYSTGIYFAYQRNKRWALEAEILFSDKGERTKKYDLGNAVMAKSQSKVPFKTSFIYHYYYVDVPLKVNYYLSTGNVKFYLTGGVSFNSFLYQKTNVTVEMFDGSVEKSSSIGHPQFEKLNFAALAGCGMNYDLTTKYRLKIEPVFKYAFTPIVNAPVKSYWHSAGINFGLAYLF